MLDDLQGVIEKLCNMIETQPDYLSGHETRTRQVLIDPLLRELGWDVSDPKMVQLEYGVEKEWADYALMSDDKPVALIEAKAFGKPLKGKATDQVLIYANKKVIPYMIVTDGDKWEMYDVFKQVELTERRIMEFQLSQQQVHESVPRMLQIWKPSLVPGGRKRKGGSDPAPPPPPPPGNGKKPPTRLAVTISNEPEIAHSNATDTFVEVIEKLGIERIKDLNKVYIIPLISTSKHSRYTQRKLGQYYIMTQCNTKKKKELLEEIASDLGDTLKVEIVQKG